MSSTFHNTFRYLPRLACFKLDVITPVVPCLSKSIANDLTTLKGMLIQARSAID